MSEAELTDELIATAMTRADARVCSGTDRCYAFPDRLEDARKICTPKGRCNVGWIIRASGGERWDAWVDVATGLAKLIPRTND